MTHQKVAVIGASGVVGRAMVTHLLAQEIAVVGFSRRPPDLPGCPHITMDLTDEQEVYRLVTEYFADITHVVYAALYEKPGLLAGWVDPEQMEINLNMLQNLMTPMRDNAPALKHVTLLQGTKAYGAHIRPMRIPGREREPRVEHPNFYWLQEDYLKECQLDQDWHWTIWRPQIIVGHALGAPMNMLMVLGVYGAICHQKKIPMSYPGGPAGVMEAVDANLLARAMLFAMSHPALSDEVFNITNGDVFNWEHLWPALCDSLNVEMGEPKRQPLTDFLAGEEPTWRQIVSQYGLMPHSIVELTGDSLYYADALFNTHRDVAPPPAILSTIKLRQAGFGECIDTEDMFRSWFERLRDWSILPRYSGGQ